MHYICPGSADEQELEDGTKCGRLVQHPLKSRFCEEGCEYFSSSLRSILSLTCVTFCLFSFLSSTGRPSPVDYLSFSSSIP